MELGRAVRRALIILGAVGTAIVVLLALAQDQDTLKIRSAVSAEDRKHPAYVAALVGGALTRGNRYDVLTNGDQIFPAMLQAIDGARRRISFETYIYDSGQIADRFTEALERAARRGVSVTVLVDAVGASPMEKAHRKRLEAAGCTVLLFNPTRGPSIEEVNYRTHRKILVVDGEIGFTGGAGVADHWMGNAQDEDHWRDTQVRMYGPIVPLLEAAFYENAIESNADIVTPQVDLSPPTTDEQGASFIVRSSYVGGSNDLKRLYLVAIASARRTLDVASPYFVTDESTEWALEDAVKRGVKIRFVVEGDITDAMPVKYASREAYDRLLSLGIEIYEYQPTMMHTKTMVVDGVFSMFGSANFDNRSLELNDELNVAVSSPDLGARLLSDFEQDLRLSRKLELSEWRRRPLLQKVREHFWSYFGEIF